MKPLTKLKEAVLPDGSSLELWERDGVYLLLQDGQQVASSFSHGSDDVMTELAVSPVKKAGQPVFLVAGLHLGYILASLELSVAREKASFIVAEPNADLVSWHRKELKHLHPGMLEDPRVKIEYQTPLAVARRSPKVFHAILLRSAHDRLRLSVGEASDYFSSLKEGGLLLISVSRADNRLEKTLQRAGFQVTHELVPASHKGKQTSLHTLVLAKKGHYTSHQERGR